MAQGRGIAKRILLVLAALALLQAVIAKDIKVGGSVGWDFPPGTDVGYYDTWAAGQTFNVGDNLLFEYAAGEHDVQVVSQAVYNGCLQSSGKLYTSGNDKVPLTTPGDIYFLCSFISHCDMGMKVKITVEPAAAATPPATPPSPPPSPPATPPATPPSPPPPSPSPPPPSPSPPPPSPSPPPPSPPPAATPPAPHAAPPSSPVLVPPSPPPVRAPAPVPSTIAPVPAPVKAPVPSPVRTPAPVPEVEAPAPVPSPSAETPTGLTPPVGEGPTAPAPHSSGSSLQACLGIVGAVVVVAVGALLV